MRKLILKMSMSLDGFVSGPNGEANWIVRTRSEDSLKWLVETLWQADFYAMGSASYRVMAAYYPTCELPFAAPMNAIPKVVFTKQGLDEPNPTAAQGSWANPFVASGDVCEEIACLKAQPGKDIMALAGANFAQSLVAHGLVNEYRLMVHPAALGTGLPLFSGLPKPLDLTLVSADAFGSGGVALVYHPA